MSYSKISVLIPTRKRLGYLQRMLDSYYASIESQEESELVFRCDSDDLESVHYLAGHAGPDSLIVIGPRRQGYKSLPGFYNEMASIAAGDLLVCGNDDMLFQTKDWSGRIIEEANKYADGIFNIGVSTGLNDDKFPFSIVSRQFVQKFGKINDERLLFSDIFLLDVMKHFGRAIKLSTVTFFHDWAGHGADETRREANQHEFEQVFANREGDWTDEYRERHNRVVREAIAKIDPRGDFLINKVITSFEAYTPPPANSEDQVWPSTAAPQCWGKSTSSSIHYGRQEFAALAREIINSGISREQIVISSFLNGLPSILWGNLFDKVTTIMEGEGEAPVIPGGKHTIAIGAVWDTRFMYRLIDQIGPYSVVVLDHVRYDALISPYYLFRRSLLLKPGMVVFVNTCQSTNGGAPGIQRFLSDLRSGYLDGLVHDVRDVTPADGAGLSYELIR